MYDIPIVLFIFKRTDKLIKIINRISQVNPRIIYIIGDGPRTKEEYEEVIKCRQEAEAAIPQSCKIVTNYADKNRGVYENIAGGAKWVFEQEKWAIFLEDDNLPEISFFKFCNEILHKYENDTRILWICGTNYLKEYEFPDGASYGFTQNMMPCGWASWAYKFNKFYEGDLDLWKNINVQNLIKSLPYDKNLKKQDISNWNTELLHLRKYGRFASWDYQMSFTLRVHNLFGVMPKYNQIKNIGVDMLSIHGGTTLKNKMTRRFCELPTKELEFPLVHPVSIIPSIDAEKRVSKIITLPYEMRLKASVSRILKRIFKIDPFDSFTGVIKKKLKLNKT